MNDSTYFTDSVWFTCYHKDTFPCVYTLDSIHTNIFRKAGREFATHIELSSGYKVEVFQQFKEVVLTVKTKYFSCKGKRDNFQIGKDRDNSTMGFITMLIYTIPHKFLADFVNSHEFYDKVGHTLI